MSRFVSILIMALVAMGVVAAESMPLTIAVEGEVMWVSSSLAMDGDQFSNHFNASDRETLSASIGPSSPLLNRRTSCFEFGRIFREWVNHVERHSLSKAIEVTDQAVYGTVTGIDFGFMGSFPGMLLQIRQPINEFGVEFRYLFWPNADFEVGGYKVCAKGERLPPAPSVGDEVVLLLHGEPREEPLIRYSAAEESAIVLYRDGSVGCPVRWEENGGCPPTKSEMLSKLSLEEMK